MKQANIDTRKWNVKNMSGQDIFTDQPTGFVFHFLTSKGSLSSLFTIHKVDNFQGRKITGENMKGDIFLVRNRNK